MADPQTGMICDGISDKIVDIAAEIAREEGAHRVNVRKIITRLGVTNRVFYNRFKNCDEVLRIVYSRAVEQTRDETVPDFPDRESFVRYCLDAAEQVMISTYDMKMQFSRYVFEHDSLTEDNRLWWKEHIIRCYGSARAKGFVKVADTDALCYAIWCFCRGYYADIAARGMQKEDAVRLFRFGFRCLLDGLLTPEEAPQNGK